MPTLSDIYNAIDSAKRKGANFVKNPASELREMLALANDRARAFNNLESEAAAESRQAISQGKPFGVGPKSQELAMQMAEAYSPVGMTNSYKGSHVAPNAENYGAYLHDLTQIMPADVYSQMGKQLYGIGDRLVDSEWRIAALKARNKPDAMIDVYRAVPKGVKDINHGDWVTTSPTYAKWHGENALDGEYEILSKKVKAKTLSSEGYPYEFGYHEK